MPDPVYGMRLTSVCVLPLLFAAGTEQRPETLEARITAMAQAFRHAQRIPGLAVGVIRDGQPIYARGFGVQRLGTNRAVTDRTLFHMASVTKTFVATGIMQLALEGKIDLSAPVSRYVPGFAMRDPRFRSITVRELLNHTSGMPDVTDYRWDHPEYDAGALARYVEGLRDSTLIADPGAKFQYSNIAFELLAYVIATTSGDDFESYVRSHLLQPLGMRHSTLLMTDVDSAELSWGHEVQHGTMRATAAYPYNRPHAGSSTLHSDVRDMFRWAQVNLQHGQLNGMRILPESAYALLWSPTRDVTAEMRAEYTQNHLRFEWDGCQIGLAWFLCRRHGRRVIWHDGDDVGFESSLMLEPDDNVAVVVMANADGIEIGRLAIQLLDVVNEAANVAPTTGIGKP